SRGRCEICGRQELLLRRAIQLKLPPCGESRGGPRKRRRTFGPPRRHTSRTGEDKAKHGQCPAELQIAVLPVNTVKRGACGHTRLGLEGAVAKRRNSL